MLPGRRFFRAARARLARLWAIVIARLRLAREELAARARSHAEAFRLRREAIVLAREHAEALRGLGEAVYRGERTAAERAKAHLAELDAQLARVEEEMRRSQADSRERIEQARHDEGPTRVEQLPVEPYEPPGPLIVPEPEPVPHEPPGPVIVPEPEPVPHEPPGPVIVPEPPQPERS